MRTLGLPTPDQVWELLDNDPYILGFNDGVYSFRDWRFYKKGAVPAAFAVSMSCGYDFPGDENGDVPPELAAAVADFERETIQKLTAGDPELGPLERAARYNVEVKIPRYNTLRRRRGVRYVPRYVRHVTIDAAACVTWACAARL